MSGFALNDNHIGERTQKGINALNDILCCLKPTELEISRAAEIINKTEGLGYIDFPSQQSFYSDIEDAISKLAKFNELTGKYKDEIDEPFSKKYEIVVDDLSDIKSEDMRLSNNIGAKGTVETYLSNGQCITTTYTKETISFEDVLSYGELKDLMETNYDNYVKELKKKDSDEEIPEFDQYVKNIVTEGEFDYEIVPEWKEYLSLAIDLIPYVGFAKGAYEIIVGEDPITGRKLSNLERILSVVCIYFDFKDIVKIGGETLQLGYKAGLKSFSNEFLSNIKYTAAGYGMNAVGINPFIGMILFQGGKATYSKLDEIFNIKSTIKNMFDLKRTEFFNILESKKTSMKDYIKSIDEANGKYKVSFKDKAGEIYNIIIRQEDLSPFEKYVCFNGCFLEGTLVKTGEGLKEINKIKDGEKVLAKEVNTGKIEYKECSVIRKLANDIVVIRINGEDIKTTPDHLFMTDSFWKSAEEIEVGEKILSVEGKYEIVEKIAKESYNEIRVYNLEVDDYHTFFVGVNSVLVHNEYNLKNVNKIYGDYLKGIPDEGIKASFKETLENIKNSGNDAILKDFDQELKNIVETDVDSISDLVNKTNSKIGEVTKGVSKAEVNTSESIKNIINGKGYSVDEFAKLLHPDRVLIDSEKLLVDSIRKEIGLPSADTLMCKTIPQSDIYKYLYNQYDGVRGFTAVSEHGANLNKLLDKYNGARLDYNNTAFKTTTGVDGISQSVGLPDKFYGTIEYKVNDVSKISIPDWKPNIDDYPYTGKGFTGSKDVVLPEYFQDNRKFMNGDIFNIIDSQNGEIVIKLKYNTKYGWIDLN